MLAYGRGRSYGDVCLNGGGTLLDTAGLDRTMVFDIEHGILRAEAGMTLAGVLSRIVPHGWFLPVTPGTQYVTLGGAVANDVHGKNHHRAGTFGRFVTAMEVVRSSGERLELTPDGEHADLFRATVGGLGLTGLITWVEFRLLRIQSDAIEKPIDRARGGIASDSEARMPGPTIARHSAIKKLAAIATARFGTTANTSDSTEVTAETTARNLRMRPGSRTTSLVAMRAPISSPMSWPGSDVAATMPRARSSRSYASS